jgi:hypothetical protein
VFPAAFWCYYLDRLGVRRPRGNESALIRNASTYTRLQTGRGKRTVILQLPPYFHKVIEWVFFLLQFILVQVGENFPVRAEPKFPSSRSQRPPFYRILSLHADTTRLLLYTPFKITPPYARSFPKGSLMRPNKNVVYLLLSNACYEAVFPLIRSLLKS